MPADLVDELPSALEKALAKNLADGEKVFVQLKGAFKEALICTNRRVLIVKVGFMTGQIFGSDVFQVAYPNIASAQVKFHLLTGFFEVSTGGMQNTPKSYWSQKNSSSAERAPTCEPNEFMGTIHNRMPVILSAEHWPAWLGETGATADQLQALCRPFPSERMTSWAVSPRVGSVKNTDASLVEPLPEAAE